MIVMKFGGSSLESRAAISRVVEIICSRIDERPVVVVSAMGKSTNRLLEIAHLASRGEKEQALQTLRELKAYTLREGSSIGGLVEERFEDLGEIVRGLFALGELTPRSLDTVASFGERLSSLILTDYLQQAGIKAMHYDARSLIITDDRYTQAAPLNEEINRRCREQLMPLAEDQTVILGGFIGSTIDGFTTTLGRGGSDYSASLIGAACGAKEIQIWTDVDGMLTCDPRVIPGGHRLKKISFGEAAELAYFGAKVLHPSTVIPAIEEDIPVRVLNSRNPGSEGTTITAKPVITDNLFKAIACKQGITCVHVHSTRMLMAHGFLRKIFEVFDRYETPVDLIATSEVSVSVTIDSPQRLPAIVSQLMTFSEVRIEERQAIISLVGEGLNTRSGILARVFDAVRGINVRMVSQGSSNQNLSFVIADADVKDAVMLLHKEFFTEVDPEVFAPQ